MITDPYLTATPQKETSAVYSFPLITVFYQILLIIFVIFLFMWAFSFVDVINSSSLDVFLVPLFFSLFALSRSVRGLQIDQDKITVKYWLHRANSIDWKDVQYFATFSRLGRCGVIASNDKTYTFPIRKKLGLQKADTIIKTIIERASLRFHDGVDENEAVYIKASLTPVKNMVS